MLNTNMLSSDCASSVSAVSSEGMSSRSMNSDNSCSTGFSSKDDPVRVRQKQVKLSKLYHAAMCPCEAGENCPGMKHCHAVKRLYGHVLSCHAKKCEVPGCRKNKKVWKHFLQCNDVHCLVCAPVRKQSASSEVHETPSENILPLPQTIVAK
mmetsp:Transcript_26669/g.37584  ORF Transcript_26669/g.37584 Transcript_26669/m.37584 type:complete len:152 (+) Transcript_26669:72-527(+)